MLIGKSSYCIVSSMVRPNWDRYFLDLCEAVSKRATCDRGSSGCVIVKDKRIMTTGYVGAPSGLPHCDDVGHDMRKVSDFNGNVSQHCVRTLHAEQNAIIQAAYHGVEIRGAILYCTNHPCIICSKMIINAGIQKIVFEQGYADSLAKQMLKESKVRVEKVNRRH